MTPLFINYPSWIHPEIFPGVPVLGLLRWYGLMYILAFGTAYILLSKVRKEGALDTKNYAATEDDLFSFIATGIIFLLLGARIVSALVYDTSGLYRRKPWLIFWPFSESGKFTGLAGMSYHGGFIGGLLGREQPSAHSPLSWPWLRSRCTCSGSKALRQGAFKGSFPSVCLRICWCFQY